MASVFDRVVVCGLLSGMWNITYLKNGRPDLELLTNFQVRRTQVYVDDEIVAVVHLTSFGIVR